MRVEEPLHLVAQPRAVAAAATPDRSHQLNPARQEQLAGLGPHGFGAHPCQQQRVIGDS